ncbi:MAG: sulfite exporter TauE/SafE family protein [Chloroflexi bacterium]|nr:MAG: hypothetical protein CUN54_05845 [Phototrophicales bacterium]RMF80574.1 MAG: sulfite exporter TauE/SafE family protein [Chloroflexota bacterium]
MVVVHLLFIDTNHRLNQIVHMEISLKFFIIMALVNFFIGLSKGGLGGPIPVALTVPLLSQVLTVPQAISISLPFLMFGDAFALRIYWHDWDERQIRLLLLPAVVGVALGLLLLTTLPDIALRRILGVAALLVIGYKLSSTYLVSMNYRPANWHGYLTGGVAGFASALANTGSPPFTAYMLLQNLSPRVFIGTSTLFFAIVNGLKFLGILSADMIGLETTTNFDFALIARSLWAAPLIPIGVWLGRKLIDWINPTAFEWIMIGFLFAASLTLLLTTPLQTQ